LVVKKILLDTNAYTRLLAGEANVLHVISAAETVYTSVLFSASCMQDLAAELGKRKIKTFWDDF